ncbi:Flp family type IVb pilin [Polycladidibacter stylochi]|uniref:Flp family type IVb pilin n=1 Tax=Polycladidibacter stylochi TaxID=1807766 RepID=UPI0009ECA42F|nr:Flp family type IVb pilin [Pseudovibrio stylochi]
MLKKFRKDKSAATAVEYALIAAIMATILIAIFATLKTDITASFSPFVSAM